MGEGCGGGEVEEAEMVWGGLFGHLIEEMVNQYMICILGGKLGR